MSEPKPAGANGVPPHESELRRLQERVEELTHENQHLKRELDYERMLYAKLAARDCPKTTEEWIAAAANTIPLDEILREMEEGYEGRTGNGT